MLELSQLIQHTDLLNNLVHAARFRRSLIIERSHYSTHLFRN
jgi:hypothetical protein